MFARATHVLIAAAVAGATGCLGSYSLPDAPADLGAASNDASTSADAGNPGLALFNSTVKPILDGNCAACHDKDGSAGPSFLKPVAYDTLQAAPGMIVETPAQSLLITKGLHEGPALSPTQSATVLAWLTLEASRLPPPKMGTSLETMPQKPKTGANTVKLDQFGTDFTGTTLTFDAALLGASLELSNITVHCDGANGVHIVHPLFIVNTNGTKVPDPVDSFSNLDETVAAGNSTALGPGTLFLDGVGALDQLSIAFHLIEKSGASMGGNDDGGVVSNGGCKDVAGFTMNAQPKLSANCVSCHGGSNPGATGALDMSKVSDLSGAGQDAACGQILTKVNPAAAAMSAIFNETNPAGNANHPFKFNGDANAWNSFVTAASMWITTEK
jgi:mono/diheme cytochrome c family protein